MSAGHSDRSNIRLSVLDRLLDDQPTISTEVAPNDTEKLKIIQQAVRRDLEALLNTRYRCVAWPPMCDALGSSLVNYGIPDFTAAGLNAAGESSVLVKAIHLAIQFFEPRLVDVRVAPVSNEYHYDRTFRFRIEGVLTVEGARHLIKFDSSLESTTGQFAVE